MAAGQRHDRGRLAADLDRRPVLAADGEIDLLEGLQGSACYHWHGPRRVGYGACPSGTFTGGWHTFGVDWEPAW